MNDDELAALAHPEPPCEPRGFDEYTVCPEPFREPYSPPEHRQTAPLVLVTRDWKLTEEAAAVAAAASCELGVVTRPEQWEGPPPLAWWTDPESCYEAGRSLPDVVVCRQEAKDAAWGAAEWAGGVPVAVLPRAASWLVSRLLRQGAGPQGHLIGVVSGSGGLGCTTLAALLGLYGARTGASVLLAEADGHSYGVMDALAAEDAFGLGWEDFGRVQGKLNPTEIAAELPAVDKLTVLGRRSPGGSFPDDGSRDSILTAVRSAFETVILDLGRSPAVDPSVAEACDEILLLVAPTKRGIECARDMAARVGPEKSRCVVVQRRRGLTQPSAPLVADLVGLPRLGVFSYSKEIALAEDAGALSALTSRPEIARLCAKALRRG